MPIVPRTYVHVHGILAYISITFVHVGSLRYLHVFKKIFGIKIIFKKSKI